MRGGYGGGGEEGTYATVTVVQGSLQHDTNGNMSVHRARYRNIKVKYNIDDSKSIIVDLQIVELTCSIDFSKIN